MVSFLLDNPQHTPRVRTGLSDVVDIETWIDFQDSGIHVILNVTRVIVALVWRCENGKRFLRRRKGQILRNVISVRTARASHG